MENDSKVKSYADLYGGASEEEDVFTEDEKDEMIHEAEAQSERKEVIIHGITRKGTTTAQ